MRLASFGVWMALMVAFGVACSDGGGEGGDDSSGKDVVSVDPNESAEACCRVFGSEQEDECIEIDQHRACTEVEQCKALNPTGDGCACSLCYGQKCIEVECRGAPTGGGEDAF